MIEGIDLVKFGMQARVYVVGNRNHRCIKIVFVFTLVSQIIPSPSQINSSVMSTVAVRGVGKKICIMTPRL